MELFFVLHDHKDVEHNRFSSEFTAEATFRQLKEEIHSVFKIDPKYQHLFSVDGKQIDGLGSSTLFVIGLKNVDKVIVKHSLLPSWSALLECEASFQKTYEEELKKSIYTRSKGIIKVLIDSLFFVTYVDFNARCTSIEKRFLTYFDRKVEAIKISCQVYFKKMYGQVKVTFESREDGSRAGCLCILDDGSTISKYYVKTHHGAGHKSSHTRYDIDLKELFVYKFLEQLKMGAEIHFIDNEMFSKWIIYIGSREIPGFKTLEFLERTQPQTLNEYSKSVVQMLFVYSVLMLGDHHTANMGLDSALNPFIVDFFVIGKPLTSVKDLHESVRMANKFNQTLGTFDERLKISVDYLKDSNFSTIFESSVESFFQTQKPVFDKSRFVFDKPQKTNDLKEYVSNVRKNIKLFDVYSLNE